MRKLLPWVMLALVITAVPVYLHIPRFHSASHRILGKWYQDTNGTNPITLTFFADGNAVEYHQRSESYRRFRYEFLDEVQMKFTTRNEMGKSFDIEMCDFKFRDRETMSIHWRWPDGEESDNMYYRDCHHAGTGAIGGCG